MTSGRAYAEEHPTANKDHLGDWVRLVSEPAVFALQVLKRDGHVLRGVFKSAKTG